MKLLLNKINAFQKVVEAEFERFLFQTLHIQNRLTLAHQEISNLKKTIINYEINMWKELIRAWGNMQAIDVYMHKPQVF